MAHVTIAAPLDLAQHPHTKSTCCCLDAAFLLLDARHTWSNNADTVVNTCHAAGSAGKTGKDKVAILKLWDYAEDAMLYQAREMQEYYTRAGLFKWTEAHKWMESRGLKRSLKGAAHRWEIIKSREFPCGCVGGACIGLTVQGPVLTAGVRGGGGCRHRRANSD